MFMYMPIRCLLVNALNVISFSLHITEQPQLVLNNVSISLRGKSKSFNSVCQAIQYAIYVNCLFR